MKILNMWDQWVFLEVKNEFEYPKTVSIHPLKLLSTTSLSTLVRNLSLKSVV